MGLVFERPVRKLWPFGRQRFERVFLLYLPMPNVLIVDRLLRDCIAYIDQQSETRPAPHNHLFLITDMNHKDEVTSAASGVVNFLLKIDLGSLCPDVYKRQAVGRLSLRFYIASWSGLSLSWPGRIATKNMLKRNCSARLS